MALLFGETGDSGSIDVIILHVVHGVDYERKSEQSSGQV